MNNINTFTALDAVDLELAWKELRGSVWQFCQHTGGSMFWDYPVHPKNNNGLPGGSWYYPERELPKLHEKVAIHLPPNFEIIRVIVNGQTLGQSGSIHQDGPFADTNYSYWTALTYLNQTWEESWGGHTGFYNQAHELITKVVPVPGMTVLYPSSMFHQAEAPLVNELRVTMAVQGRSLLNS